MRPSVVCAQAADVHVQPSAMTQMRRVMPLAGSCFVPDRLPNVPAFRLDSAPPRRHLIAPLLRRSTMSLQPVSLSQLAVLTVIAFGALARGAHAQKGVGVFTEHGDVGTVTRPGSA